MEMSKKLLFLTKKDIIMKKIFTLLMIAFVAISTPAFADGGDSDGESDGDIVVPVTPDPKPGNPQKRSLLEIPEVRIVNDSQIFVSTDSQQPVSVVVENDEETIYIGNDDVNSCMHIFDLDTQLRKGMRYTIMITIGEESFIGWFEL